MESSPGQSAQRWKRSIDAEKVKQNGGLFDSNLSSSFICSYCAKSKLSATPSRRNKFSSLSKLESVVIQDTILFTEASAFDLARKHPVECLAVDGKHRVACLCGTPVANPIASCHNKGLQSIV